MFGCVNCCQGNISEKNRDIRFGNVGIVGDLDKRGFGTEVEMEDRLERGEDLIIGRNKEVLVSNIMLNMFNRKM